MQILKIARWNRQKKDHTIMMFLGIECKNVKKTMIKNRSNIRLNGKNKCSKKKK